MCQCRFTRCLFKRNNEKCLAVQKRELWVNYLLEKVELTKAKRTPEWIETTRNFVMDAMTNPIIHTTEDLQNLIVDILHSPNETWKAYKKHYML